MWTKKRITLILFVAGIATGSLAIAAPEAQVEDERKDFITNKQYRTFVHWVRDSIARKTLAEEMDESYFILADKNGQELDPPQINWKPDIDWQSPEHRELLEGMYYPTYERFLGHRQIDARQLMYDLEGQKIHCFPDTLIWIDTLELAKRYDPRNPHYEIDGVRLNLCDYYFHHPYFDDYPVQGLSARQLEAFEHWKRHHLHRKFKPVKHPPAKVVTTIVDLDYWQITNGEYDLFLAWSMDSVVRRILGEEVDETYFDWKYDMEERDPPLIDWKKNIDWKDPKVKEALLPLYPMRHEKQYVACGGFDRREYKMEHYFFNYYRAARVKGDRMNPKDRSLFIGRMVTPCYPDTASYRAYLEQREYTPESKCFYDKKTEQNDFLKGATYHMVSAYYFWRRYSKAAPKRLKIKEPAGYMVIPSKHQWEQVRDGRISSDVARSIPIPSVHYHQH